LWFNALRTILRACSAALALFLVGRVASGGTFLFWHSVVWLAYGGIINVVVVTFFTAALAW
jgi:hypothetical protein